METTTFTCVKCQKLVPISTALLPKCFFILQDVSCYCSECDQTPGEPESKPDSKPLKNLDEF